MVSSYYSLLFSYNRLCTGEAQCIKGLPLPVVVGIPWGWCPAENQRAECTLSFLVIPSQMYPGCSLLCLHKALLEALDALRKSRGWGWHSHALSTNTGSFHPPNTIFSHLGSRASPVTKSLDKCHIPRESRLWNFREIPSYAEQWVFLTWLIPFSQVPATTDMWDVAISSRNVRVKL